MSELIDKIKARGYWTVVIRPRVFVKERVDLADLSGIIQRASVHLRGWDYPHFDTHSVPTRLNDFEQQETDWDMFKEVWKFYQSGQFAHVFAFHEDWRDESSWWPASADWQPRTTFGWTNAIFQLSEIFEFASRYSMTQAGDEEIRIRLSLANLSGRALSHDSYHGFPPFLHRPSSTSIDVFPFERDCTRGELATNGWKIAAEVARQLFQRFYWDVDLALIEGLQERLRKGLT